MSTKEIEAYNNKRLLASQLIGIIAGGIANGDKGANAGYKITTSADTYNRQLHQRGIDFIYSMADDYAAKNNISKEQAVKILYAAASALVDKGSYNDFASKEKF